MYTHSPAAYKALQSFEILKLPSKSTMQAYTGTFLHSPGANNVCTVDPRLFGLHLPGIENDCFIWVQVYALLEYFKELCI